jgi:hypothetical protein
MVTSEEYYIALKSNESVNISFPHSINIYLKTLMTLLSSGVRKMFHYIFSLLELEERGPIKRLKFFTVCFVTSHVIYIYQNIYAK